MKADGTVVEIEDVTFMGFGGATAAIAWDAVTTAVPDVARELAFRTVVETTADHLATLGLPIKYLEAHP